MKQKTKVISLQDRQLRGIVGDVFIVTPAIRVKKADVESVLVDGILKAGTLLTKEGKPVTTTETVTDAFGINYTDVDFNDLVKLPGLNEEQTAPVSLFVLGAVKESEVYFTPGKEEVEKAALNKIILI